MIKSIFKYIDNILLHVKNLLIDDFKKVVLLLLYQNLILLPVYIFKGRFWAFVFLLLPFVFVITYNAVLLKRHFKKFIKDLLILCFLYLLHIVILF